MSNCKAYLRHDPTTQGAVIRLPARMWSIVERKQARLAEELGVKHVSRPVVLQAILKFYEKYGHLDTCVYNLAAFENDDLKESTIPTY